MLLEGEDLTVDGRPGDGAHRFRPEAGQRAVAAHGCRLHRSARTAPRFSRIGTPGLVEALRQGSISMVNALGLRHPRDARASLAFMPQISARAAAARSWSCPASPPGGAGRTTERRARARPIRPHDGRPGVLDQARLRGRRRDRARRGARRRARAALMRAAASRRRRLRRPGAGDALDRAGLCRRPAGAAADHPARLCGAHAPRAGPSCRAASPASARRSTPPPSPCSAAARRPTSGWSADKPVERVTLLPQEGESFTRNPAGQPAEPRRRQPHLARPLRRALRRRRCASCAPITRGWPKSPNPDLPLLADIRAYLEPLGIDAEHGAARRR